MIIFNKNRTISSKGGRINKSEINISNNVDNKTKTTSNKYNENEDTKQQLQ
jgi:hypothetical protein